VLILLDMDDVIVDFEAGVRTAWDAEHPDMPLLPTEQRTQFKWAEDHPEAYRQPLNELIRRPGFFASLPPMPGALQAIAEMVADGHQVFLCSAPPNSAPHAVAEKTQWVIDHLGSEWTDRLMLTRDKTLARGDVLVDDKPEVVGALEPVWEHVHYDRPYNRDTGKRRITNWANWRQILTPGVEQPHAESTIAGAITAEPGAKTPAASAEVTPAASAEVTPAVRPSSLPAHPTSSPVAPTPVVPAHDVTELDL
jgi:5'-nucleotidase